MKKKKSRPSILFLIIFILALPALLLSMQCKNDYESTVLNGKIEIPATPGMDDSQGNELFLSILTQNTMLIPFNFVGPAFDQRTGHIIELVRDEFDIVLLQEVFNGNSQDRIVTAWHEMIFRDTVLSSFSNWQTEYFSQWFDLLPGKDKKMWYPLEMAGDTGTLSKKENFMGVEVLDTQVNNIEAELVCSPYYVMGPDRGNLNIRQDGGLAILSRYPIKAASALTYKESSGSDRLASKGALYARIQVGPSGDDYIHVFNTHIQAHDYGESRLKQIKELMDFIQETVRYDNGKDHPIIVAGDFNVTAGKPEDWIEISGVAPPEDEAGTIFNAGPGREYEEFLGVIDDFSKSLTTGLKDSWMELKPQDPGFTWIGKDWITGDKNPYGSTGNSVAISEGEPKRIDYIFYFEGSGPLELEPITAGLVPEKPDLLYCFDKEALAGPVEDNCSFKSYTVSDHLGLNLVVNILRNSPDT